MGEQAGHGGQGAALSPRRAPHEDPDARAPALRLPDPRSATSRRYTPEMVEQVCGCPPEQFDPGGRDAGPQLRPRADRRPSATPSAGRSTPPACRSSAPPRILQLLLGNIGRPGGGIMALRGHATIQGSTDIPTLYNLLPGYLPMPHVRRGTTRWTTTSRPRRYADGFWANFRKFIVSLLKAWYGDAATPENDFGFDWLPRIAGDHSHMPIVRRDGEGQGQGLSSPGAEPGRRRAERRAPARRRWPSSTGWWCATWSRPRRAASGRTPEVDGRRAAHRGHRDRGVLPAGRRAAGEGAAASPTPSGCCSGTTRRSTRPGDCRSELGSSTTWAGSPREAGRLERGSRPAACSTSPGTTRPTGEIREPERRGGARGDQRLRPGRTKPVGAFTELKDDGSTACGCWIYCGVYPGRGEPGGATEAVDRAAWPSRPTGASPGRPTAGSSTTAPRPTRHGKPWSERKSWSGGTPAPASGRARTCPTSSSTCRRTTSRRTAPSGEGARGDQPFIMQPRRPRLAVRPLRAGDGPLPAHYEPVESPVGNLLYGQRSNPVASSSAGRATRTTGRGRAGRRSLPLRADHLPADRAPHGRRDEPLRRTWPSFSRSCSSSFAPSWPPSAASATAAG